MEGNSEGVRRREGGRERRRERGMERDLINRGGRSNLEPKFTGTEGVRENGGSERERQSRICPCKRCAVNKGVFSRQRHTRKCGQNEDVRAIVLQPQPPPFPGT